MNRRRTSGALKAVPAPGLGGGRERLAFNFGGGTVPTQAAIDAAIANEPEPTFATAPHAEPRDWGYVGLLTFTVVMLVRPQRQAGPCCISVCGRCRRSS